MPVQLRAREQPHPHGLQIFGVDTRRQLQVEALEQHMRDLEVTPHLGHGRQLLRRELDLFVLQQAACQFHARVFLLGRCARRPWQQHPRLDLDQQRRHQQVLGCKLEPVVVHHVDVLEILARQLRHRDVEHVQVLLANQVEQQVERTLEALENDLQRIGRDVEILGYREHRLAVDACDAGHDGDHRGHLRAGHRRQRRLRRGGSLCIGRGLRGLGR